MTALLHRGSNQYENREEILGRNVGSEQGQVDCGGLSCRSKDFRETSRRLVVASASEPEQATKHVSKRARSISGSLQ